MSFDLVDDVFEPVFQRLGSEIGYLSQCTPERIRRNRGLETNWFQPKIVTPTLKERGRSAGWEIDEHVSGDLPGQKGKVDLRLRHTDWEVLLELKAANDFRVNYVLGLEKDGWFTKYVVQEQRPHFAGCLFLGCASDQTDANTRLTELAEKARVRDLALTQHRAVATHDGHYWILGLLATPYGRALAARKDEQLYPKLSATALDTLATNLTVTTEDRRRSTPQGRPSRWRRMRQTDEMSYSRTITDRIKLLPSSLKDCLEAVTDYLSKLGSDVEMHKRTDRLAFKKVNRNFAHVEVRSKDKILIFVRLDPSSVRHEPGFTRSGFKPAYSEGEVEITIRKGSDVERAKPLLQRAYAET